MHRFILLVILLAGIGYEAASQNFLLKGHVYSSKMEPVPLVEVRIKELQRGATTD